MQECSTVIQGTLDLHHRRGKVSLLHFHFYFLHKWPRQTKRQWWKNSAFGVKESQDHRYNHMFEKLLESLLYPCRSIFSGNDCSIVALLLWLSTKPVEKQRVKQKL